MADVVPVAVAARLLRRSRRTVERWLERGAPYSAVRGRRLVDVDELERWRRGDLLDALRKAIEHVLRRDCGNGEPLWRAIGAREDHAIAICVGLYERAALEIHGETGRELPPELRQQMSRLAILAAEHQRGQR